MPDEVSQNLQHLRLYVLQYSCAAQLEAVQIRRHVTELVHRIRRVRSRPCHLHILSTQPPRQHHDSARPMLLTSWWAIAAAADKGPARAKEVTRADRHDSGLDR